MLGVEQWAELRRRHFVQGISIRQLQRDTGLDRKTIRRALRSDAPPRYARGASGSKLDPFKSEIHRLLRDDRQLPNVRVGELLALLGYARPPGARSAAAHRPRALFFESLRGGVRYRRKPLNSAAAEALEVVPA